MYGSRFISLVTLSGGVLLSIFGWDWRWLWFQGGPLGLVLVAVGGAELLVGKVSRRPRADGWPKRLVEEVCDALGVNPNSGERRRSDAND